MALSKITLLGMAKYLNDGGGDLFAQMVLPAGINRQDLIDSIFLRGAEFEVLYADADMMQYAIGAWSRKWQHTLTKWADVLKIDYNPLENYDRYESWSDDKSGSDSRTGNDSRNGSDFRNESNERTGSNSQNGTASDSAVMNSDQTRDTDRAAYDSATYSPVDRETTENSNNTSSASVTTAESSSNESGTRAEAGGHTESENRSESGTREESAVHTGRTHGNIGVTTSQQMLQSEWEVAKLNVYEAAADLFLGELTIYTY